MVRKGPCLLAGVLPALALCACGTVETFERDQVSIDPDAYVVALSFDTTALSGDAQGDSSWDFYRALLYPTSNTPVAIAGGQPGLTLVMLESPGPEFSFGDLALVRMNDDQTYETYESRLPGPKVALERGSATYVGTLVVDSVIRDPETKRPTALGMRTRDRWDYEARAWRRTFRYFEENEPVNNVAGNWGESASIGLQRHTQKSSRALYERSISRSGYVSGSTTINKPRVRNRTKKQ